MRNDTVVSALTDSATVALTKLAQSPTCRR